ncbi:MAG: asparagine synthase-related protein [Defluviitaleaceae bacterium]|nr:asparagine synthase-related protein [Defluviitaleaceae bacterium]
MNGIGGIVNGIPCEEMLAQIKGVGQYVSPQACLFGSPKPVMGTLGLQTYVGVCDGELYNKDDLVKELHPLGYRFADRSDAAVLLHSYMAWGIGCLEKLTGVFAFAIWDGERLTLARDRMGYKPLLYGMGINGLIFASSIKTILCHPGIKPTLTQQGVAELMLLGPYRTPGCGILKGINELRPGHCLVYRTGNTPQIKCYWRPQAKPRADDLATTVKTVRGLLADAVKSQTQSGGKYVIGTGEPESSILASLAGVRTVSAQDAVCSDEWADALTPATEALGFPACDADAVFWLRCKQLREASPAVLSGEGADTIFGSHPWYTNDKWSASVRQRLPFIRHGALGRIDPEEYVRARFDETINAASVRYDDEPTDKRIRQMTCLTLQWYLPILLTRIERMSDAVGLTVRLPFLDHRLADYMYNVPWAMKNHGDNDKGLLREAFKGIKADPPTPATPNPSFLRKLQDMMREMINTPNSPLFEIVDRERVKSLASPQTLAYFLGINAWLERFSINISL